MRLRELHLFAGIGGGVLGGILLGHECVAAVESDQCCQAVLRARQADGCLPKFPIFDDVREFDGREWRGRVDVVCGGFPCQPWSTAGKRLGTDDPRHLWPEMARIVDEVRPAYVFAENVSLAAFAEPWRDLRRMGYRVPPALRISASDLGAPHQRNRWWLLAADAARARCDGRSRLVADADSDSEHAEPVDAEMASASTIGPTANGPRLEVGNRGEGSAGSRSAPVERGWWAVEPPLGRVADGVPNRVGQLRALGNAQVPAVAAQAFRILMETHFR